MNYYNLCQIWDQLEEKILNQMDEDFKAINKNGLAIEHMQGRKEAFDWVLEQMKEHWDNKKVTTGFVYFEDLEDPVRFHGGDAEGYCYFYISTRGYWEETGCWADWLRTADLTNVYPEFKGSDDMESHFEFPMTKEKARAHMESLGIEDGDKLSAERKNRTPGS